MTISIANRTRLAFAAVVLLGLLGFWAWYAQTAGRYATYQILPKTRYPG